MRKALSFFMLLPLLVYLMILLGNYDVLLQTNQIHIAWIYSTEAPLLLISVIFFTLYCLTLWSVFRFSGLFSAYQSNKQHHTIDSLKAELHDQQPKIIAAIETKFETILEKMDSQHQKNITTLKRENDKILGNMEVEIKTLKEKMKDFIHKINS